MPLHLPYFNDTEEYERVNGEITLNGVYYNYVKRRVSNDTVYLMCIPNKSKTQLYQTRIEYSKQVNDIPNGEKKGRAIIKKINPVGEYNQLVATFILPEYNTSCRQVPLPFASTILHSYAEENFRPPRV